MQMETRLTNQLDFNIVFYRHLDRCGELAAKIHESTGKMQVGVFNYKEGVDHLESLIWRYIDDAYLEKVPMNDYGGDLYALLKNTKEKLRWIMLYSFKKQIVREMPIDDYGDEIGEKIST